VGGGDLTCEHVANIVKFVLAFVESIEQFLGDSGATSSVTAGSPSRLSSSYPICTAFRAAATTRVKPD